MNISTVKYRNALFPKPDLTIILGIPTYDTLQRIQLELKTNAHSVHNNLWVATHWYLRLLMTGSKYATLSNFLYIRTVQSGILIIQINSTSVAYYKLKRIYNENILVFHEVRRVKQALIQQILAAIDEQYIIAMKNQATGQFTGNTGQIFFYLLTTYRNFHQASSTILKRKWLKWTMTQSPQLKIFSIKLKTLSNTETWKTVPILALKESCSYTTSSTILESSTNPSSPGIVFLQSIKRGFLSRPISAKHA